MGLTGFSGVGGAFNFGADRATAPRGAFWIGQDGNVYVAGSEGVNSAGRADANSKSYWSGKGFTFQNDPNPQQNRSAANGGGADIVNDPYPQNDGSGGGGAAAAAAANAQISYIDQLLGNIDSKEKAGLDRLNASYGSQKNRLGEQKTKTFAGYDKQSLENAQSKERGVGQVDSFANSSYNNLQRILQGGNAGNSSVGKFLVPQLVSKAAGSRRQGVFDTAGKNESDIVQARGDAEDQYRYSFEDLDNQRKDQEQQFREGILGQRQDLTAKKLAYQQDNGLATAATEADLASRSRELDSLFGRFKPTFNAKAMNLKTPELGQYTVDPATLRYNQQGPTETRAYLPALQKKKQLEQGA